MLADKSNRIHTGIGCPEYIQLKAQRRRILHQNFQQVFTVCHREFVVMIMISKGNSCGFELNGTVFQKGGGFDSVFRGLHNYPWAGDRGYAQLFCIGNTSVQIGLQSLLTDVRTGGTKSQKGQNAFHLIGRNIFVAAELNAGITSVSGNLQTFPKSGNIPQGIKLQAEILHQNASFL